MKLKISLRNSASPALPYLPNRLLRRKSGASPALVFSIIACAVILFSGCLEKIEPTYKENDIPRLVKKICKQEYNLEVTTDRVVNTLWIYAPLDKLLHKDYGIKEDKIFDEETVDKLRNILTTIGRVLISSDNTPEFYALVVSDIKLGLDYMLIGDVLDIKKSYAGVIPWTEANRRYVVRLKASPEAIADTTGKHLQAEEIKLGGFLAEQVAQRITAEFQQEGLKKYFKVDKSTGSFIDNAFLFEYSIEPLFKPPKETNIQEEILKIIAYCLRSYDFNNFSTVELKNLLTQDSLILGKTEIWARPMD